MNLCCSPFFTREVSIASTPLSDVGAEGGGGVAISGLNNYGRVSTFAGFRGDLLVCGVVKFSRGVWNSKKKKPSSGIG